MPTLTATFTASDLRYILPANLQLIMALSTKASAGFHNVVACSVSSPQISNTFDWSTDLGPYRTNSSLQVGAQINAYAHGNTGSGGTAVLDKAMNWSVKTGGSSWTLQNNSSSTQALGLYSHISTDGVATMGLIIPTPTPPDMIQSPGSIDKLHIWVGQNAAPGTIMRLPGTASTFDATASHSLKYDLNLGGFTGN